MDDMDNLIEAARCLGLVQARKSFGQYGPDDAASECGLHASISERSARLRAEVQALKTDIATYVGINTAQLEEVEALRADASAVIRQCRDALAEELSAYDIQPPIYHVLKAHERCVAWLSVRAEQGAST